MKKLIVPVLAAALALAASADETKADAARSAETLRAEYQAMQDRGATEAARNAYSRAITTEEWRALADYAISVAKTNVVAGIEASKKPFSIAWWFSTKVGLAAADGLAKEYDDKFLKAGIVYSFPFSSNQLGTFPTCCQSWMDANADTREYLANRAMIRAMQASYPLNWWESAGPERFNAAVEGIAKGVLDNAFTKEAITRYAVPLVKAHLRASGKTFVARDGENPMSQRLAALAEILDRPRFAGLAAFVKELCPDFEWYEPQWKDAEELEQLKESVFDGKLLFTVARQRMLEAHLGVEAYNRFVERYNNDVDGGEER